VSGVARRNLGPGYVIAGAILLAMATKRIVQWGAGWTWPIPDLLDPATGAVIPARISQEYREWAPGKAAHYGVDLMWNRGGWMAPAGAPVVAARDGVVWSAEHTPRGIAVVLDHGPPWATFYQHLERLDPRIVKGAKVAAGDVIGDMGADPLDPARVRHLHFAAWYQGSGDKASVDPADAMVAWRRWQWSAGQIPLPGVV